MTQTGDILLFQGSEGLEIEIADGLATMTQGLETLVLLSLIGGNEQDDGSASTDPFQWWFNEGQPQERKTRPRFGALLTGRPISSGYLTELKEAAEGDLSALIPRFFQSVKVSIVPTGQKKVRLTVDILTNSGQNDTVEAEITP